MHNVSCTWFIFNSHLLYHGHEPHQLSRDVVTIHTQDPVGCLGWFEQKNVQAGDSLVVRYMVFFSAYRACRSFFIQCIYIALMTCPYWSAWACKVWCRHRVLLFYWRKHKKKQLCSCIRSYKTCRSTWPQKLQKPENRTCCSLSLMSKELHRW